MAIVVKSKRIKDDITDENGNVLGIISYNPEDTRTYTRLSNVMNDILKIDKKRKSIGEIKDFSKEELQDIEDFEKYRESFEKVNEILRFIDEKMEHIIGEVDSIFGEGTCNILMEDTHDIELLVPLLESVMPNFEKARNKKTKKYLNDKKVEENDVMD